MRCGQEPTHLQSLHLRLGVVLHGQLATVLPLGSSEYQISLLLTLRSVTLTVYWDKFDLGCLNAGCRSTS